MTKQELNRDVKRLFKKEQSLNATHMTCEDFYTIIDNEIKPEFLRLYRADKNCEYFNLQSLKMLISLNQRYSIIPQHQFFLTISI
jgi:hypothetical protein